MFWASICPSSQNLHQCTRLHTGSSEPQPQHLGKYNLFSTSTYTHSPATHTPTPMQRLTHTPAPHTCTIHIQPLQQPTNAQFSFTALNTIWSSIIRIQPNTPEEGHIDARNM